MRTLAVLVWALALFGLCAVILTVHATPGQLMEHATICNWCWEPLCKTLRC